MLSVNTATLINAEQVNAEQALGIVEKVLHHKGLSKLQMTVFRYAWDDHSYQEIARTAGYEVGYIKQAGSQLWQSLSQAFGEKVTKSNLQLVLKRKIREMEELQEIGPLHSLRSWPDRPSHPSPAMQATPHPSPHVDWGEATDVSLFCGRGTELATLTRWIGQERCRLVGIFGMGGMGKTAIATRLAQQIQGQFDRVIWRSLRNAPPLQDLLTDLLQFCANHTPDLPTSLDRQLLCLLEGLRRHRCLLILDNAESLLDQGDRSGWYRPGYEGYGRLFSCLGESVHQSCLILTSREKPKELVVQEGDRLPIRSFRLRGLPLIAGQAIVNHKGNFSGSPADWQALVEHYAGNPLVLKIVAAAIADFFDGNLCRFLDFLHQGSSVFGDIRDLLESQINRLPSLEQQILYGLAVHREPTTLAELQTHWWTHVFPSQLLEALTGLERRSLIECTQGLLTLQPVVMEYITNRLNDDPGETWERWQRRSPYPDTSLTFSSIFAHLSHPRIKNAPDKLCLICSVFEGECT